MEFFTADAHFGHKNIMRLCGRPFRTVCEMNHALIANWNKRVSGDDTVYILGDLFYKCDPPEVLAILSALKGKKKLITGNHDEFWLENCPQAKGFFLSIEPFWSGSVCNHGMTLCHYPLVTYKHQQKDYQVHGHIHNDTSSDFWPLLKARTMTLNAGVDVNGFEPVTLEELMENNRKWKKLTDEHENNPENKHEKGGHEHENTQIIHLPYPGRCCPVQSFRIIRGRLLVWHDSQFADAAVHTLRPENRIR